jgi:predicted nuclease of predicted toxin-antitoxin system
MKVVVDEGVPRQLVSALRDFGIDAHRFNSNWNQMENGALIAAVEAAGFTVLLTNDKNIASQQSLNGRAVAVVAVPVNRKRTIMQRVADIADTILRSSMGQHIVMGIDGSRTATRIEGKVTVFEDLPPVATFKGRPNRPP